MSIASAAVQPERHADDDPQHERAGARKGCGVPIHVAPVARVPSLGRAPAKTGHHHDS